MMLLENLVSFLPFYCHLKDFIIMSRGGTDDNYAADFPEFIGDDAKRAFQYQFFN
jgi:hypothetical protein